MIIILLICSLTLLAPGNQTIIIAAGQSINPYEKLWEAVKIVESRNNPLAFNRHEGAYGVAQIRQVKLNEYYKYTGHRIKLRECFSEEVSKDIFMWHCMKHQDIETSARRWNGSGPMTTKYWNNIKRYL